MVKIIARTREEFDRLDGLAKKLFEKVIIDGSGLIVQDGILGRIKVSPEKFEVISRIHTQEDKTCLMSEVTLDYIVLEVDNQQYQVEYKIKEE
ncbi:hypothetical protein M0R72_09690 [Candidatus Pacearchaeota archaeon]|jgi:hypothetical protein|nr:hypothetical protein [Candidatus Pacearchaeota archaeon]